MPLPPRGYVRLEVNERYEEEHQEHKGPQSSDQLSRLQKADVLKWFHDSPESDAAWVLNRLTETVPHLIHEAVSQNGNSSQAQPTSNGATSHVNRRKPFMKQISSPCDAFAGDPIIQFTSSIFYAAEGVDETMVLDVMRIGNREGTSEVFYETQDDSALNGRNYTATSGKLVFKPGESLLHIEVSIMDNRLWDATTEFKCRLKQQGLRGAVLGQYLHTSRVKIIDNDHFPNNSFKHLSTREEVAASPKWSLLFGYFDMVSNIPNVWRGTMKYMLIDAVHNLLYLFNLFLTVYILDFIVDVSRPDSGLLFIHDKRHSLILCSCIKVAAVAVSHVLDIVRLSLPIAGPARKFVQSALLRKFLNYKTVVREHLPPGHLVHAILHDSGDLCMEGYVNLLKIFRALGKLICMVSFKVCAPHVFHGAKANHSILLLLVVPALMAVFLRVRQQTTSQAVTARNETHTDFENQLTVTSVNYHLVIDYSLRNHCEYRFLARQKQHGLAVLHANHVLHNNMYFCKWCQAFVIAVWIWQGGLSVINGSLTVGMFVTTMGVFESLGASFLEIYTLTVEMMNTFPALENITTLMNYPTDVEQRYHLKRAQRAETVSLRKILRQELDQKGAKDSAIDVMPILLSFKYPFKFEGKNGSLNFKGHVELRQGQLVAVIGSLGCGKATLLRLIAGSVLSTDGRESPVFVPSHLRIANVADEPLFFGGTLYESLTFGLDESGRDASHERVKSICKRLTRSHTITDYLDSDAEESWKDIFSGAQCKLLAIARALIHNVEVLCIHKPLGRLNHDDAEHVIAALHDHVESKGLELVADPAKRRPRTVIVSAATDRAVDEAHNVIEVDPRTGLKLLPCIGAEVSHAE